jgi:type IV secretory pathway TrbD component
MLPQPWGAVGQLLPPGAGVGATRSVAFFDGAGATKPSTVLAIWLVAGLALLVLGGLARSRSHAEADPKPLEMSATPFS